MKLTRNIAIKDTNKTKIDAVLNSVQEKCKVRLASYSDVVAACETIEKRLDIPARAMVGVVADVDPNAQTFPRAYREKCWGRVLSTHFTVVRTSSGWSLCGADRAACMGSTEGYSVTLTDAAKAALIKRATKF